MNAQLATMIVILMQSAQILLGASRVHARLDLLGLGNQGTAKVNQTYITTICKL